MRRSRVSGSRSSAGAESRSSRASRPRAAKPAWLGQSLLLLALGGGAAVALRGSLRVSAAEGQNAAVPASAAATAAPATAEAPGTAIAPGTTGAAGAPGAAAPKSPTVRLVIKTVPPKRAFVFWGKKRLGIVDKKAPLIIQRPRDSGPLDLLVRADDCVPVYTRAYTFDDNTLAVRVTALDQKQTIYGYKAELPPEDGIAPDAAAPGSAAPGAPPSSMGGRGGSVFTR